MEAGLVDEHGEWTCCGIKVVEAKGSDAGLLTIDEHGVATFYSGTKKEVVECVFTPTAALWLSNEELIIVEGRHLQFYSVRRQTQGGECNLTKIKSIPWSESDIHKIVSISTNKPSGGKYILLLEESGVMCVTSLSNNTTTKLRVPLSKDEKIKNAMFLTGEKHSIICITQTSVVKYDLLTKKISTRILDVYKGCTQQHREFACSSINPKLGCAIEFDSTIKLLDLEEGKILKTLENESEFFSTAKFANDGKTIYLGSCTGRIYSLHLETLTLTIFAEIDDSFGGGISSMEFVNNNLIIEIQNHDDSNETFEVDSDLSSLGTCSEYSMSPGNEKKTPVSKQNTPGSKRTPLKHIQLSSVSAAKRKLNSVPEPENQSPITTSTSPTTTSTPASNLQHTQFFPSITSEVPLGRHPNFSTASALDPFDENTFSRQSSVPQLMEKMLAKMDQIDRNMEKLNQKVDKMDDRIQANSEAIAQLSEHLLPVRKCRSFLQWRENWMRVSPAEESVLDLVSQHTAFKTREVHRQLENDRWDYWIPTLEDVAKSAKTQAERNDDVTARLDKMEILIERLARVHHIPIPLPRDDNRVPWE